MQSAVIRVVVICALVELSLLVLFGAVTRSLISAVVCLVSVGGPASLWLAPLLLRHYARARSAVFSR
jgi:hypothetical protein